MKDKNFYSNAITPKPGPDWINKSEDERKKLVFIELKKNSIYNDFFVSSALSDGQVILKIEKNIPADKRGILLIELEKNLKTSIDEGLTLWCEPVGDKSKLRNLRGIKFNKKEI